MDTPTCTFMFYRQSHLELDAAHVFYGYLGTLIKLKLLLGPKFAELLQF